MTCPHHNEGAPPWSIAAAEAALADYTIDHHEPIRSGDIAASVTGTQLLQRVHVTVFALVHDQLHARRPSSDRARAIWTSGREEIARTLAEAGFTDIAPNPLGVLATAPESAGPPQVLTLTRSPVLEEVGVYTLNIDGHPHLAADIDGGFHAGSTSGSGGYRWTATSGRTEWGYGSEDHAARGYALHCGFAPPFEVRKVRTITHLTR